LVYELMDTDLHQIIRSPQTLSNEHFQYFIYQASPTKESAMMGGRGLDTCKQVLSTALWLCAAHTTKMPPPAFTEAESHRTFPACFLYQLCPINSMLTVVYGIDMCEAHTSDGFLTVHRCLLQLDYLSA
jgi:hypothetical protein